MGSGFAELKKIIELHEKLMLPKNVFFYGDEAEIKNKAEQTFISSFGGAMISGDELKEHNNYCVAVIQYAGYNFYYLSTNG